MSGVHIPALNRSELRLGSVCVALVAGEVLGLFCSGGSSFWPVLAFLAIAAAWLGADYSIRGWPVAFCFLLGLTLMWRAERERAVTLRECEWRGGFCEGAFPVRGDPRIGEADGQGMRWVSFPSAFAGGRLRIMFHHSVTNDVPKAGETWRCAGWLDRRKRAANQPRCLWVKGRVSYARRDPSAALCKWDDWMARVRRDLSRRMGLGLEGRSFSADLNRAMVLGERAALPYEMRQDFIRSGTMHVFAISGLHVAVVSQILLYVLLLTVFPIRWAGVVLVPALWLYVVMIGMPPSAVRAAAMASAYYAAPIFWRRPNALTAWEVTVIVFALLDPIGLFGVGSLLSFAVVLGILLFIRWARPFKQRWVMALGVPFAAWAAGVPIAAHVFARLTPGGLFANLIEVPLASGAVLTSILGILASFVSDGLAKHVNGLAGLLTEGMAGVSWMVARIPGADLEIAPWSLSLGAAWYVGIILSFVWIKMVWARRRASLA